MTVTAVDNSVDAPDKSVTVSATVSGGNEVSAPSDQTLTLTDDEGTPMVSLELSSSSIGENGGSTTVTATLNGVSSEAVEVTVSAAAESPATSSDFTLSTNKTLTIAAGDRTSSGTVTVTAVDNSVDAPDKSVTVSATVSGGNGVSAPPNETLTITDDDTAGIVLNPTSVNPSEGGTESYTVQLLSEPTATVTIAISGTSGTDLSLSTSSLTFTTSDWGTAQTVTVSAGEDADAADDTATLTHTASGGDYANETADVSVTVDDDESVGLVLSKSSVNPSEGGSESYTVALSSGPTAQVTVAVTGTSGTDLSLNTSSLTFTTSTWGTAQTVTVSAGEDADATDDTTTLTHAASGGDYAKETADVSVTVDDDESVGLVLSKSSVNPSEGGSESYTVKLSSQPTATVTVAISGTSGTDLSLNSASLTFTTSTWGTAQTVTVSAGQDADAADDTATLRHTASGGDYASETADVSVTVGDDESAGLVLSKSSVNPSEGGERELYGEAVVSADGDGDGGDHRDVGDGPEPEQREPDVHDLYLGHGADGDGVGGAGRRRGRRHGDASAHGVWRGLRVGDGGRFCDGRRRRVGGSGAVEVVGEPVGGRERELYGEAVVSADGDGDGCHLGHQRHGPEPEQREPDVHDDELGYGADGDGVGAGEDADAADDTATLRHTASGGDYASETADVSVTVGDDESAGLVLSKSSVNPSEGGSESYTVKLSSQPTATVTVAITGTSGTDLSLNSASLTFTTSTWGTAQTVTVSAGQDADAADDTATLRHTASGGDYASETADVSVTVGDDESAGLVLSKSSVNPSEGGSESYTVKLSSRPTATVTVAISGTSGTDLSLNSASLTFTTSTWGTAQTVTVSAGQDADAADDTATLRHTASGGDYASETADVSVTVDDDESAGLVLSKSSVNPSEGGSESYTVKLSSQPTATVTVAISGTSGNGPEPEHGRALTSQPTTSWGTAQTVTVSIAGDGRRRGRRQRRALTFTTASGPGDYASETADVVCDGRQDDDVGRRHGWCCRHTSSGGDYASETAGARAMTVKLSSQPTATVTVAITGTSGTDLSLNTSSLTFTTSTWGTAQTVTVSAGEDADAADDTATLRHTASGGDYASETADVSVTVDDDESAGLVLSKSSLTPSEGGNESYTVALSSQPTATVTVAITGHSGTDLSLNSASLTFTTSTWGTAQTVTVSAGQDADAADDTATLRHTASGGDYASETADVSVTVGDDESAGLVLSKSSVNPSEGGSESYTVKLSSQPTATVTVAISGTSGTDLSLSTSSLTFTTTSWGTAQTVTVSAGEDADAADDTATLRHTASGGDYASETADVSVTVGDDESAGLVLSKSSVNPSEGGSESYTVKLSSQPTATVTVAITGTSGTDLSLNSASLTFTTSTWGTAQTVTVSAGQDADAADDTATLRHTASGGDYASETADVSVTVGDDESAGLVLSKSSVNPSEGGSESYTVKLSSQPTATVTVAITGTSGTDLSLNSASLTFTTSTWGTAQTVTVSAGQDADAADDTATLRHTASGGDYASETADVSVTVGDDESAGLVLSKSSVNPSEGGSESYTVKLSSQPTATVTVAISGTSGTDLSLNSASLTFTTSTWGTAQTVTVSAGQDADAADDTATLRHTASGGDYASETADVSVTVGDDESAGLVLSKSSVNPSEGGSESYTVKLSSQPTATVTVAITGTSGTDLSLNTSSLTFTTSTWGTAQTVTVSAGQDADAADDTATLRHTASGGDYASETADVSVTVGDDESAGLVLSKSSVNPSEGGSESYTVKLSSRPTATVTVAISGTSGTDLSLNTSSLTFTTSTWGTAQTVTVSAGQDADAADDTATLRHTASGGDYASETADVSVTVGDDESAGLVLSKSSVNPSEGGSESYTVKLSSQPTATVTVAISGTSGTDLSLNTSSLTFTTTSWGTAQTVTVSAGEDADAADDTATLRHTASGGDYASETADVSVTVGDDESAGLVLSKSSVNPSEGGSESYTVKLSSQPTATVTVAITGTSGTDLSLNTSSLTFTTSTWGTAQTVTVSAGQDADAADDTATLRHTASGGDYASETADVSVTVGDDESAGLVLSKSSVNPSEGGSESYTVKLSSQPTATVTVAISGTSGTDLSLNTSSLTFTTSTWGTAQTVTVSAGQDADAADDTATLRHTASGGDYASETADVSVTVGDDESAGLVLSKSSVNPSEGGSESYTVKLSSQPTATVTVAISGTSGTDLSLSTSSLTFTTTSWGTAQTVTVSAGEDADAADDTATLRHTASGGDYASETADVSVTVGDDESAGLVLSKSSVNPSEGGSESYTVKLSSQPTATVTVAISGTSGTDLSLNTSSLTFTTSTWGTAQTVTVSAGQDADAADDTATLRHTASGGDYASETADVSVTVGDDESVGLVLSKSSVNPSEGGSESYTVKLSSQPTATVTVAISGTSGTDLSLNTSSLTFTTTSWGTAQTVTVSAGEDADAADDTATLRHTASGGDYASETADVSVTVGDDESAGLVLSKSSVNPSEGGSESYTVKLSSRPTATVTVAISGTSGTDLSLNTSSLTFTTTSWGTAQTVTVSAGEDADAADDTATLRHTASGGDYASETADVSVTVGDDESAGLVLSKSSVNPSEGGSESYTVKLSSQPTATVTVAISGTSGTDLSLNSASLTFTTSTWGTAQTVTVSAGQDADAADDTATLRHTASGGDYASETADVSVTVGDDESAGLVLSKSSVNPSEGGSESYTVKLSSQPTATVTVAITGTSGTDLSLNSASLTFTTSTWGTAQTVTVSAGQDADAADDTATLRHTASGGDYASETADVSVTVGDDESAGLVLSKSSVNPSEGGSESYTVKLSSQPTATVTVAISGTSGTDLSLNTSSLTFTTSTWGTAQTVTVSAGQDADAADDTATLRHTASGGDYASETADVSVTVGDDESAGLVLSKSSVNPSEGGSESYTVKLSSQPTATVTVAISGTSGTDLSLNTSSLTFTTSTWGTAQTVTVSAGQDADAADDTATLRHTASGGDYASETADVSVTVGDDESAGLVLSKSSVNPSEGGSESYTVKLSSQPTATVTVAITGTSGTDLSLNTSSLTFTTSTWGTAQTVTVSAGQDADAADDTATLRHTASGGDYASETADVSVTVGDDESAGLVLSKSSVNPSEGGSESYTVKLSSRPTATVTVAISGTSGTDLSLNTSSLTFTTSTWGTAQTVTVSAGQDADAADDTATLRHTASGGDYASETADVSVTVGDDESAGLVLSKSSVNPSEGGSESYTVKLSSQPTATVTVAISGTSGTDLSLNTSSLTFTTTSWGTAQTVTVSAGEDADAADDTATLRHTASGGDYASETADVSVTVGDDESAGLVLSKSSVNPSEGGSESYTVKLSSQPTATVTVAITGTSGTDLSLNTSSLTFTTSTWGTAQTVTVSAGQDADAADDTATLRHTASGGDYASETADVSVTVGDDESAGLVLSKSSVNPSEGGSESYTVKLSSQPTATVTVAISGTSGTDLSLNTSSLTFTTSTWGTAQTVTVSAGQDADAADDTATLRHTASGGDYASETADVSVTVGDDESAGLVLSKSSVNPSEGGSESYTVKLSSQPTATVTVAISGTSGTDLSLSTSSLTFTTTSWGTAQTVTVSAGEDADAADDTATLRHTASGGDYASETADVSVTVGDDESAGLVLSKSSVNPSEGGSESYTVKLSSQPTATVTVAITGTSGTDLSLNSASLTFTTSTWGTAQTVTVSAGQDADAADDTATLRHTASGGDYASETADVSVTVGDDESAGLVLSKSSVNPSEGGSESYTVKLSSQPTATVTVAISGTSGTDLSLNSASLTFTTSTWGTAQTVTVSAGQDADAADDTATLRHTASGGDYASETADVSVTVGDDESAGLVLSKSSVNPSEGGSESYTVKLSSQPTATVTVAISGTSGTDLSLNTSSLTFTTTSWGTAQTVTVSAGEDADAADDTATLRHTASGGDYASETADVSVTVGDDESAGLVLSKSSVNPSEGGSESYTVKLSSQPTATVYDGCHLGHQRHGPEPEHVEPDVHDLYLGHGADGDGVGGAGRRRGRRHGDASAHGVWRGLRVGDGGRFCDGRRRRVGGAGAVEVVGEPVGGRERELYGEAVVSADGDGDGGDLGHQRHGPEPEHVEPDVHDDELGYGADGDGERGRGRRRGRRHGDASAHGVWRGLRVGDGGRFCDGRRRRVGGAGAVEVVGEPVGGRERELHGEAVVSADGDGDGCHLGHQRHGPEPEHVEPDVHDLYLGHGADGDGVGGAGRRRGRRHGDASAHGVWRGLRVGDGGRFCDGRRRRVGGSGAVEVVGEPVGGRERELHGEAVVSADGDGDGCHLGHQRHGPEPEHVEPDVHDDELGHGADGDGERGRGRRRGRRHGDASAHGVWRGLRVGDGGRFCDGRRRRVGGSGAVEVVGEPVGGRERELHGEAVVSADGDGDGCHLGHQRHGPEPEHVEPDVHDDELGYGADGDGERGRGRRRGRRHGDASAHGVWRGLRVGDGGRFCDGRRRRVGGSGAVEVVGEPVGGRERELYGEAVVSADGDGDGCHLGHQRHGPEPEQREPDVHDLYLGHGADGDGVGGAGRRRGRRHGDASAHGVWRGLRVGDGGRFCDGRRRRVCGSGAVEVVGEPVGGRERELYGEAVVSADGDGDGGDHRDVGDGPEPEQREPDVHDLYLGHGADGDGVGGAGRRRGRRHGDASAHGVWRGLRVGDGGRFCDGRRRRVGGAGAVEVVGEPVGGRERELYGEAVVSADGDGDGGDHRDVGDGPEPEQREPDVHDLYLGHGADGDGVGGAGRRRGRRHGDASAHGVWRGLRVGDGGRFCDGRRRRVGGAGAVEVVGEPVGGRERELYGEAVVSADGDGDGGDHRDVGDGPEPEQREPDVHDLYLGHGADGDGVGGAGRRRGRRHGDASAHGVWRGLRVGDGGRFCDGRRRRVGGAGAVEVVGEPVGGRERELHGEAVVSADGDGDGCHLGHQRHGPEPEQREPDVHDLYLGHGADGDGVGGAGRRRGRRHGDASAHGVWRGLRVGDGGRFCDGRRRRVGGAGAVEVVGEPVGGRERELYGEAVVSADGDGDGGDHRDVGDGPEPEQREPDVHDLYLGHGADGDGVGGAGRRRGRRHGDASAHGVWRGLRVGDGGRFCDGRRRRVGGAGAVEVVGEPVGGRERELHGEAVVSADGDGDGCHLGHQRHGPEPEHVEPDVHDLYLGHGADGDGVGGAGRRRGRRHGDASAHGVWRGLRVGDGGRFCDGRRRRVGGAGAVEVVGEPVGGRERELHGEAVVSADGDGDGCHLGHQRHGPEPEHVEPDVHDLYLGHGADGDGVGGAGRRRGRRHGDASAHGVWRGLRVGDGGRFCDGRRRRVGGSGAVEVVGEPVGGRERELHGEAVVSADGDGDGCHLGHQRHGPEPEHVEPDVHDLYLGHGADGDGVGGAGRRRGRRHGDASAHGVWRGLRVGDGGRFCDGRRRRVGGSGAVEVVGEPVGGRERELHGEAVVSADGDGDGCHLGHQRHGPEPEHVEPDVHDDELGYGADGDGERGRGRRRGRRHGDASAHGVWRGLRVGDGGRFCDGRRRRVGGSGAVEVVGEPVGGRERELHGEAVVSADGDGDGCHLGHQRHGPSRAPAART